MSRTTSIRILKAGDVDVVDGVIGSNDNLQASEVKSWVYCWVLINDSNKKEEIIYIGKYGMSPLKKDGENTGSQSRSPQQVLKKC